MGGAGSVFSPPPSAAPSDFDLSLGDAGAAAAVVEKLKVPPPAPAPNEMGRSGTASSPPFLPDAGLEPPNVNILLGFDDEVAVLPPVSSLDGASILKPPKVGLDVFAVSPLSPAPPPAAAAAGGCAPNTIPPDGATNEPLEKLLKLLVFPFTAANFLSSSAAAAVVVVVSPAAAAPSPVLSPRSVSHDTHAVLSSGETTEHTEHFQ